MQPFYDSAMIGEIYKSMRYREEPVRIKRNGRGLIFNGNHHKHHISGESGQWHCDCRSFSRQNRCSHTMTLEYFEREQGPAFFATLTGD